MPWGSPAAFRFAPSPITTFVLSEGTGVPSLDVSTSTTDEILENPGRGAGEPLAEVPGAGLPFAMGAGRVMKPVESS